MRQFYGVCLRAGSNRISILSKKRTLGDARAAVATLKDRDKICIYRITWGLVPVFIEGSPP